MAASYPATAPVNPSILAITRADFCQVGRFRGGIGHGSVVPLCDHVRGPFHFDDHRCGDPDWAISGAGSSGLALEIPRGGAFCGWKSPRKRAVCRRLGMVSLSGSDRPARGDQQPLAHLRRGEPVVGGDGAGSGDHGAGEDGARKIGLGDLGAPDVVGGGHFQCRLDKNLQWGSSAWIFGRHA